MAPKTNTENDNKLIISVSKSFSHNKQNHRHSVVVVVTEDSWYDSDFEEAEYFIE